MRNKRLNLLQGPNAEKWWYYCHFVFVIPLLLYFLTKTIIIPCLSFSDITYNSFEISDYLINYEGGFVRRGLLGQILFGLYSLHPFNVKRFIFFANFFFLLSFLLLELKIFSDRKWSILPIIFPLLLGNSFLDYRRDFLTLLFVYGISSWFISYIRTHEIWRLIISILLLIVLLLIYEPAFFLTVPILILLFFFTNQAICLKKIVHSVLIFSIPVTVMGLSCLYSGDHSQAATIWESWRDLFIQFPDGTNSGGVDPEIGLGVDFLKQDFVSTVRSHFRMMFDLDNWPGFEAITSNILLLSSFPITYLLVSRVPVCNMRGKKLEQNTSGILLSSLFIVQCIAMFPMFFFLSCDFGRTLPLVIYSSFILCYLLEKNEIEFSIPVILPISCKLQLKVSRSTFLSSALAYLLLVLFLPLSFCFYPTFQNIMICRLCIFVYKCIAAL